MWSVKASTPSCCCKVLHKNTPSNTPPKRQCASTALCTCSIAHCASAVNVTNLTSDTHALQMRIDMQQHATHARRAARHVTVISQHRCWPWLTNVGSGCQLPAPAGSSTLRRWLGHLTLSDQRSMLQTHDATYCSAAAGCSAYVSRASSPQLAPCAERNCESCGGRPLAKHPALARHLLSSLLTHSEWMITPVARHATQL
jgi:hypothetical protein